MQVRTLRSEEETKSKSYIRHGSTTYHVIFQGLWYYARFHVSQDLTNGGRNDFVTEIGCDGDVMRMHVKEYSATSMRLVFFLGLFFLRISRAILSSPSTTLQTSLNSRPFSPLMRTIYHFRSEAEWSAARQSMVWIV